jgi:hypothetical protein
MKKKFLIGSAVLSFSAFLSVGALVGVASSQKALKANAAGTASTAGTRLYVDDATSKSWTGYGVNPSAHMWNITFDTTSGFTSVSQLSDIGATFGSSISFGTDYINVEMSWNSGGTRPYEVVVPWYITSFRVCFYATENGTDRYLYYKGDADSYQFDATRGNEYKVKAFSNGDYGAWWDGSKMRANIEKTDVASYTYTETTYSVTTTASPAAGGTVSGAGTYKKYQYATVTATPNSGYSFSSWSDSGTASHSFHVTADTALTATFSNLPALSTPVLTKGADNSITWAAVANAQSYNVTADGVTTSYATTDTLKVDGLVKPGSHTVSVVAVGDHSSYNDSLAASETYTVADGFFLVGSFQSWDYTNFVGAARMSGADTSWSVDVALPALAEFKVVYANDSRVDWQGTAGLTTNPQADLEYPIEVLEGGNIKVTNAGNYRVSVELDNGNASYTVLALDYQPDYKLLIGSTEVALSLNSGNEYKVEHVNLTRGATLGFKNGSTTVNDSFAKVIFNNNLDSSKKVLFSATDVTVYVDVVAKSIFAEGMPNVGEGYHVIKNGSSIITMTHNENPSDPSYTEWYTSVTSFAANDVLTFLDKKASGEVLPVEFKITTINAGGLGDKFEVTADGIRAKQAVDTAIYLKLKSGADEVYFGEVSEAELKAREFASNFLTAINAVCDPNGVTTDTDDLADAWAGQVTAFGGLIKGAQDILKAATAGDSVKEIRDFIAQYTYVLTKYGKYFDASTRDFLNKGITPNPVAENHLLFTKDSTTNIAMVTIIAVVGLTAIGSVVYLRARKHQ